MQKRHKNKQLYFTEQELTTQKYIIPYLSDSLKIGPQTEVLEIGCGEGGNLKPFLNIGCKTTGIDISCRRIELAKNFFKDHPCKNNLELICENIYNVDLHGKTYDLIIMRDVIEHLPDQKLLMHLVKKFLKPDGKFFVAFPPWQNPFGGHQQVCNNKIISKTPYIHLLPKCIYKTILYLFEKNKRKIEELLMIKNRGISIEKFEKILRETKFSIHKKTLFLINPNYETKFGLKPRQQYKYIESIPWLRNFFTTTAYYIVSKYSN